MRDLTAPHDFYKTAGPDVTAPSCTEKRDLTVIHDFYKHAGQDVTLHHTDLTKDLTGTPSLLRGRRGIPGRRAADPGHHHNPDTPARFEVEGFDVNDHPVFETRSPQ